MSSPLNSKASNINLNTKKKNSRFETHMYLKYSKAIVPNIPQVKSIGNYKVATAVSHQIEVFCERRVLIIEDDCLRELKSFIFKFLG